MKKKQLALWLIFLVLAFAASAQNNASLSGKITDTQQPLAFATVSLLLGKDSSLVKIALTDSTGAFLFERLAAGEYRLTANYVGMKPHIGAIFALKDNEKLEWPTITLATEVLKTVTISAKKNFVEHRVDRTVVNPEALIANAGMTALDVLEKAPLVAVDMNGLISLRGKNGVMVFIDDKPTYLAPEDLANYLRSLQSNTIASIEIMTNPPAKYDAAGNAGIINIRLKKNTIKGTNGSIAVSYGQGFYARTNNSASLNYRRNKVNFFSNANFILNNSYQDLTINRKYFAPNAELITAFDQRGWLKIETGSANARAGFDYYPSKKTTLGMSVSGFLNPARRITNNKAQFSKGEGRVDSVLASLADRKVDWENGNLNLNATHKIGSKGKEITANVDVLNYKSDALSNLTNQTFLPNGQKSVFDELVGNIPTTIGIQTAKLDYAQPVKGGNFEAGAKVSFIKTDNKADFFDVTPTGQKPNIALTNYFQYDENIVATYVNWNRQFGKIGLQAGLRYEHTLTKGSQTSLQTTRDSIFERNYGALFPTFFASMPLDSAGHHILRANYGRRINRPDYQSLNPFIYPLDKFTLYGGNPFLNPTFTHSIELTHIYKSWLSTTLSYSYDVDDISETIRNEGFFFSRPGNIGNRITTGLTMNAGFNPIKKWTFNGTGQVIHIQSNGEVFGNALNNQGTFGRINITNQFALSPRWTAELGGIYTTPINSGQFVIIAQWNTNAGVQCKVMDNKGNIRLAVNDLFHRFRPGGEIVALSNSQANWLSILDTRVATLSFSYRFNKGQNLKLRTNNASESEKSRVKTN